MSSVILPAGAYGRNPGNTRQKNLKKLERFFIGFIIILLVIIVLELVFHFLIAPSVVIDRIIISTDSNLDYSDDFLLKQAGLGSSETFFNLNTELVKKRLLLIPAVKSVGVRKVFPSALKIDISSRVPVGLSLVSTGEGIVPVVIDNEGVVFQSGSELAAIDLPVVSGLNFPEIKGGMRIPKELCSFLEDMDTIRKSAPGLYGMISEVKFVKKGSMDYEVLLFPENHRTRLRIGSGLDEEMLKYMIMVLEVISGQAGMENLEEIDFRTGDVVYRIQGE